MTKANKAIVKSTNGALSKKNTVNEVTITTKKAFIMRSSNNSNKKINNYLEEDLSQLKQKDDDDYLPLSGEDTDEEIDNSLTTNRNKRSAIFYSSREESGSDDLWQETNKILKKPQAVLIKEKLSRASSFAIDIENDITPEEIQINTLNDNPIPPPPTLTANIRYNTRKRLKKNESNLNSTINRNTDEKISKKEQEKPPIAIRSRSSTSKKVVNTPIKNNDEEIVQLVISTKAPEITMADNDKNDFCKEPTLQEVLPEEEIPQEQIFQFETRQELKPRERARKEKTPQELENFKEIDRIVKESEEEDFFKSIQNPQMHQTQKRKEKAHKEKPRKEKVRKEKAHKEKPRKEKAHKEKKLTKRDREREENERQEQAHKEKIRKEELREQLPEEKIHEEKLQEQLPKEKIHEEELQEQLPEEEIHEEEFQEQLPEEKTHEEEEHKDSENKRKVHKRKRSKKQMDEEDEYEVPVPQKKVNRGKLQKEVGHQVHEEPVYKERLRRGRSRKERVSEHEPAKEVILSEEEEEKNIPIKNKKRKPITITIPLNTTQTPSLPSPVNTITRSNSIRNDSPIEKSENDESATDTTTTDIITKHSKQIDEKDLVVMDTVLGEGQIGIVNLAKYRGLLVACKSKRSKTRQEPFYYQIQRELKYAADLSVCRYINRYFGWIYCSRDKVEAGVTNTSKKLYVIQKYIANGDARSYLNGRDSIFHPYEAIQASICLFSALSDAHALGIGLVDLKLENFLIDSSGAGWLTDFGSCIEFYGRDEVDLDEEEVAWTTLVAAPEMIRSHYFSKASDVFMATLVVAELLTVNLSDSQFYKNVLGRRKSGDVKFSSGLIHRRYNCLIPLLHKGLANNSKDRPTASEILRDLIAIRSKHN